MAKLDSYRKWEKFQSKWFKWYGHVMRKDEEYVGEEWWGRMWRGGEGREERRWMDSVNIYLMDKWLSRDVCKQIRTIYRCLCVTYNGHVSDICKSCFYHIRDLRRIRRHISLSTAKTISNALISSRLDYCNSLLNNIAKQDLSKLQRVQNCTSFLTVTSPAQTTTLASS